MGGSIITSRNLIPSKATIVLYEYSKFLLSDDVETHLFALEKYSQTINFKVTKSKIKDDEKYFLKVSCNNEEAETGTFGLKDSKKKEDDNNVEKCLCKKTTWSADDLKYIVTQLRKKEGTGDFQTLRDKTKVKNFVLGQPIKDINGEIIKKELSQYDSIDKNKILIEDRLFYLDRDENVLETEKNYENLSKWINYIFAKINAKDCINKIHVFSHIYHETERLGTMYESDTSASKSGEDFYRGRGLIMITKKYNYKTFYKFQNLNEPTIAELEKFTKTIANNIEFAAKSASWYLNTSKFKNYFSEEVVDNTTASINYPKALITKNYDPIYGMKERRLYFNLLKQILNYDECKN